MNTDHLFSTGKKHVFALFAATISLFNLKSQAQIVHGKDPVSDTITYVMYNNDLNFDQKRSLVFNDKKSVDSLAHILATKENKQYQIVYRKEGRQAQIINAKYLRGLDMTGFYTITIAYNKPGVGDDTRPMYIITSK